MSKISKKVVVVLLIVIMLISAMSNTIKAAYEISEAYIIDKGQAAYHLKYYNEKKEMSTYVICNIVGHNENGVFYPAYCLNRDMHGVGNVENYYVDVDSVITDNRVWRTVKNGYPYKTAEEMGVWSDDDAFVVTKMAVYCALGQSDINLFSADEGDQEAQAMLAALRNLVNKSLEGNEGYSDSLKVEKSGGFVEDDNYYSQTYKVTAESTVSSYKIKSISGLAEGDIVTDINGNIKTSFNSGENFKIKILKSHLDSDKNISFEIEASLKNYPMFYGKTRISGTQNYLLTANSYQNITTNDNLNLKLNTGKIKINKVDQDTNQGVEGVTFELYKSDGTYINTYTTNSNGNIEISGLYQGDYILKETKSNENYVLNQENESNVYVEYNKNTDLYIQNEHKKGNLNITKIDKDNHKIALGNVEFDLYSEEFGKVIGTYYTNADGQIYIENLRTGNYSIIEKTTNSWYNLAENTEIQINWDETTNSTIENELKKGQIQVEKVDKENNNIKLQNVEFQVLDENRNILETITTNEQGIAVTKKYTLRDYGILYLKETKTDEKYVLNDELIEVKLQENETVKLTFENEKIKGNIQIIKTTSDTSEITGIKKGDPLENVKFEIYNESKNLVDTITTNKEGIAKSKELEKGTYKIKEVYTNEWYLLDENYYTAEIITNKQIVTLNLENKPATPNEAIEKIGPDMAQADEQIEYKINVKNTGNVALNNFIWEDEIPTDYIRITKMNLGTYNQQNTYNLYYKTNFTDNYILLLEDVSTTNTEEIDFSKELSDNEYITNIKLDFGTVDVGFETQEETYLYAKVNSNVKRDDVFENKVTLTSNYKGYNLIKQSSWKTKIYKILPLTGI